MPLELDIFCALVVLDAASPLPLYSAMRWVPKGLLNENHQIHLPSKASHTKDHPTIETAQI